MKAKTTVAGLLAAGAAAQNSTSTCASGLQIIVARGSTEPVGSGRIGVVADGIVAAVPGSQIAPIAYPASLGSNGSSVSYFDSVDQGVTAMKNALTEYNSRCPSSKVAVLGYSQGANVATDTLCGQDSPLFNESEPISSSIVDQSVVAVVLFGDPTHEANVTWNKGTADADGLFPRTNYTSCLPYAEHIASWCDEGDWACAGGDENNGVHGSYFANYTDDAVEFVVSKFNASKTDNNTDGGSPSSTPTPAPTSSNVAGSGAAVGSAPGMLITLAGLSVIAALMI